MDQKMKRKQTKQLILDTTIELVQEKGCSKMTLNDITKRSGLSKGAIYHYVKSKNELLALVLHEQLEQTNRRFFAKLDLGAKKLDSPLTEIMKNLSSVQKSRDPVNLIFNFLLGENEQPAVRDVIRRFYEQSVHMSKTWIVEGQRKGAISREIDAEQMAELFVLITYGMRMRSAIAIDSYSFNIDSFAAFMTDTLQLNKNERI